MTKRIKLAGYHHPLPPISDQENHKQDEEASATTASLIPGLPDHVAQICLSKLPPPLLFSVCSAWRRLLYSPLFPPFPSLYILATPSSPAAADHCHNRRHHPVTTPIHLLNFDPISCRWTHISPPPSDPPLSFLTRHPSFLSRNLPIQSISVANTAIVLLAAATDQLLPAIPRPLVFSPVSTTGSNWSHGPPIPVPRRWCAAGSLAGTVFMASGIGSNFNSGTARSLEKWELLSGSGTGMWEKLSGLRDGRFCREAIEAVGWKGKLCMVNVKGDAAKEGAVYDVRRDRWDGMPEGMLAGWRGPAAAMEEEVIYVVDESRGMLRRYDEEGDAWVDVIGSERLRQAQHVAAGGGRVCVGVGGGGGGRGVVVVVDVVAAPVKFWVVELPGGFDAVTVHVLPRMSRPESDLSPPLLGR